jgi:hypothetical protein
MRRDKRFSLPARILGGFCTLGAIGVLFVFAISGIGLISGMVLAASVAGVVVPCVTVGASLLEVLEGILELVAESISTLLEAIFDAFASLFG